MRGRFLAGLLFLGAVGAAADQTIAVGPGISFSPSDVTISPGETVTWAWAGAFHSSTSDLQTGPEVWDSGIIATGTFAHTFTTPGIYHFYCKVHSFPGGTIMNGSVTVLQPVTPTPTPTVAPPLTPTPTATFSISPSPTVPRPTSTPSAAVPTLGPSARLAMAFGLVAAALFLLLFSRR